MADQRGESYRSKGEAGIEKEFKKLIENMELRLKEWWSGEMHKLVTNYEKAAEQKIQCQNLKAMVTVMTEEAERGQARRRLELVQWEREKQAYEQTIAELREKIKKYQRENEEAEAKTSLNRSTDRQKVYDTDESGEWEINEERTRDKNILVKGACVSELGIEHDITEFIRRNMYVDPKIKKIERGRKGWVVTLGSPDIKKAIMRQEISRRRLEFWIDDDLSTRGDEMEELIQGQTFEVVPPTDCPHLDTVADVPRDGINVRDPCQECLSTAENWICLGCYKVYCSRNVNRHALTHGIRTKHPLTLSLSDFVVWCYDCEAFIDDPRLSTAKNAAQSSKFNRELSWTHNEDSARAREWDE